MKAKIIEIFDSIQGEGKYVGAQQIFVRFFECNMHCTWCDTPHSIGDTTKKYREVSLKEILTQIKKLWKNQHSVSITGGEPLLQADFIHDLLLELRKLKIPVHLDTNGTLPNELKKVISYIDVVAMDLKLPSSTKQRAFWKEHKEFFKIAKIRDVFIKTVITQDTSKQDIEHAVKLVSEIDPFVLFFLQPNTFELNNGALQRCREFQQICSKKLKNVRVLPQVHKFLKVR